MVRYNAKAAAVAAAKEAAAAALTGLVAAKVPAVIKTKSGMIKSKNISFEKHGYGIWQL